MGKQLQGMTNRLALMIEGYDDDPRQIFALPEVRTFYKQLWQRCLCWLYF